MHQLQKEVGKGFYILKLLDILQIFIKGHQYRAYLGSNERVPKPSKAVTSVQQGDLKQSKEESL